MKSTHGSPKMVFHREYTRRPGTDISHSSHGDGEAAAADAQAPIKSEDIEVKEDAHDSERKWPRHHEPLKLDWIEAISIASTGSGLFDMVLLLPPPPRDCAVKCLSDAVRPALEYPNYHAVEGILQKCAHVTDASDVVDVVDDVVKSTLLDWAIAALDDLRLIRFLDIAFERGLDVDIQTEGGEPLYCHDKVMRRPKLFCWFLGHGAHVNKCTTTPSEASRVSITEPTVGLPLHKAISSKEAFDERIIEALLRHRACPLKSNALHAAIRSRKAISIVKLLADYGYDWDPYEWQGNEQFDKYWKREGLKRHSACSLAYSLGNWNLLDKLEKLGFDTSLGFLDPATDRRITQPQVKKWRALFNQTVRKASRPAAKAARKAPAESKDVDQSPTPPDVVALPSQTSTIKIEEQVFRTADALAPVSRTPSDAASRAFDSDTPRRSKRISSANELSSNAEMQLTDTLQPTALRQEAKATVGQSTVNQSGTQTRKRNSSAMSVSTDGGKRRTRPRVSEVRG